MSAACSPTEASRWLRSEHLLSAQRGCLVGTSLDRDIRARYARGALNRCASSRVAEEHQRFQRTRAYRLKVMPLANGTVCSTVRDSGSSISAKRCLPWPRALGQT